MLGSRLIIAAFIVPLAAAVPAAADEVIVVNVMPTGTNWMIGTQSVGPVPKGGFAIIPMLEGKRSVYVVDGKGAEADKEVLFDPAQFARHGPRGFWCLLSRPADDGAPEVLLFPQDDCQKFIDNQPPPPGKP